MAAVLFYLLSFSPRVPSYNTSRRVFLLHLTPPPSFPPPRTPFPNQTPMLRVLPFAKASSSLVLLSLLHRSFATHFHFLLVYILSLCVALFSLTPLLAAPRVESYFRVFLLLTATKLNFTLSFHYFRTCLSLSTVNRVLNLIFSRKVTLFPLLSLYD